MSGYTKYPPPQPRPRTIWLLIWLLAAVLVVNVLDQGGVW